MQKLVRGFCLIKWSWMDPFFHITTTARSIKLHGLQIENPCSNIFKLLILFPNSLREPCVGGGIDERPNAHFSNLSDLQSVKHAARLHRKPAQPDARPHAL